METENNGPVSSETRGHPRRATSNRDWWPNQMDLTVLHRNPPAADPMGAEFDYAEEFKTLTQQEP